MPYVAVKNDLDRTRMIEHLVLVDPNQYCAVIRTVWPGGFGLNVERPATRQEKTEAFEIIREQMSLVEQRQAEANMKVTRRLTAKLSDNDELR